MSENMEKQILRLVEEIEEHEKNIRKYPSWEDQEKVKQHTEAIDRKIRLLEILKK